MEAEDARLELTEWLNHSRVVWYEKGLAVQLHKSGPYLGQDNIKYHHCYWCPGEMLRIYHPIYPVRE
jgi:hypothetical protein